MSKDLIREDTVLGKKQIVTGASDKDLVLQTKGKVKIQQGNRFIDLLENSEVKISKWFFVVDTVADIGDKTGFYFVRENSTLYAVVENKIINLNGSGDSNNESNTSGVDRLSELKDVLLINLRDGDLLVYENGYWVNSRYNIKDLEGLGDKIEDLKKAIKSQSDYTQRTFQDVMETFEMMFDPEGEYFTDKIKPLAVHTAQLIVGTNSQQFNLENIKFEPNYKGDCNTFGARVINTNKPGILIHNTIGLEENSGEIGRTWNILRFNGTITKLDFFKEGLDPDLPYYLYAKCSRYDTEGEFIISEKAVLLEAEPDYYYFWVGVLNTPRASIESSGEGVSEDTVNASLVRSFQCMFGFTEITGNQITTGVIKDQLGSSYWDMINGAFKIGDGSSYIYYDSKTKQLYLKGNLVQVDPEHDGLTPVWKGVFIYDAEGKTLYKKGDLVNYNGNTYICKKDVYNNILPTNTEFWELYSMSTFTKFIYANFKEGEVINPDNVLNPTNNGWSESPKNPDFENGEYTWMSQTVISNNTLPKEGWSTPIKITGSNGEAGVDGSGVEFIYRLSRYNDINTAPSKSEDVDGYIPSAGPSVEFDWTNHPTGVSDSVKYEFVCVRSKVVQPNLDGKHWGPWSKPAVWSKWGEKGMDGDGYEYIYKIVKSESDKPEAPKESPQIDDWTPDSTWSDDPKGVTETFKFEYVTKRKKENGLWGKWSPTALWSKWSKDGMDGEGTVMIYKLSTSKPETPESSIGKVSTTVPSTWHSKIPEPNNNTVYTSPENPEDNNEYKIHLKVKTGNYTNVTPEDKKPRILYNCSTEPNYDKFYIDIDDARIINVSGEIKNHILNLEKNSTLDIKCIYHKDSSRSAGLDKCWFQIENAELYIEDDTKWTSSQYYLWMSLAIVKNGLISSNWSDPIQWGSNGNDIKLIFKNSVGQPNIPSVKDYLKEGWSTIIPKLTNDYLWYKYTDNENIYNSTLRIIFYNSDSIIVKAFYNISGNNECYFRNVTTNSYIKSWAGKSEESFAFTPTVNDVYEISCSINHAYKEDFFKISFGTINSNYNIVDIKDWIRLFENTWMSFGYFKDGSLIGSWSVPTQMTANGKIYGEKGSPGEVGPSMVFRGNYTSGDIYYGTKDRTDVVFYNSSYYMVNYSKTKDFEFSGVGKGKFVGGSYYGSYDSGNAYPSNAAYWIPFGASFSSVATNLLFANNASLGGWNFNNKIMWSNDKNCYLNGKNNTTNEHYPIIAASISQVIAPSTDANSAGTLKTKEELDKIQSFYVDSNGYMHANAGKIGQFEIKEQDGRFGEYLESGNINDSYLLISKDRIQSKTYDTSNKFGYFGLTSNFLKWKDNGEAIVEPILKIEANHESDKRNLAIESKGENIFKGPFFESGFIRVDADRERSIPINKGNKFYIWGGVVNKSIKIPYLDEIQNTLLLGDEEFMVRITVIMGAYNVSIIGGAGVTFYNENGDIIQSYETRPHMARDIMLAYLDGKYKAFIL